MPADVSPLPLADGDDPRGLFDLTGRVALVTGATRGSLAIASGYASAGAQVIVVSRKLQACERVATASPCAR